jgi:cell division septum initiation protein DivIVA
MAANGNEELFKTTLMGGFDKEDVLRQFQKLQDDAASEKSKLLLALKGKDKKAAELEEKLKKREAEIEKLKRDISEKYQSYIDNYDTIGQLIYDARIQTDKMRNEARTEKDRLIGEARTEKEKVIGEARAESEKMLSDAREEREKLLAEARAESEKMVSEAQVMARQCLDSVQHEVDERLLEGKKKYIAVQEELNDVVELINQVQRRFMQSYKSVHAIVSSMPESLQDLEDEMEEELSRPMPPELEESGDEEESSGAEDGKDADITLDEEDSLEDEEELDAQIARWLKDEEE